jgi:hypothetical protein
MDLECAALIDLAEPSARPATRTRRRRTPSDPGDGALGGVWIEGASPASPGGDSSLD